LKQNIDTTHTHAAIHEVKPDGDIGDEVHKHTDSWGWPIGWSSVASYVTGGKTYCIFLKQDMATSRTFVAIHKVKPDGDIGDEVYKHETQWQWPIGWKLITGSKPILILKVNPI
jgi:hypothetical protein